MRTRFIMFMLMLISLAFALNACSSSTPSISVKPSSHNFGDVETSASVTFTLENNTKENITVNNISFQGVDADKFAVTSGFAPFDLQPDVPVDVTVEFTPLTSGVKEGEMVIETSYIKKPIITRKLKGRGFVAFFDPLTHDFGTVDVGSTPLTKDFTLINDLERDITISSFDITGTSIADFSITAGTPGLLLANGGSTLVTVEFNPLTHGPKSAQLTATSNDGIFTTIVAELIGEGNVDLIETFDATTMSDTVSTTAEWGTTISGELTPTGLNLFGTGVDGAYNPTSNANLDADAGPYNYTSINIPSGVVITVTGSQALEILCQGEVKINGELILDGGDGADYPSGTAGVGGPGGYNGGAMSQNGNGPGAGSYSTTGGGAGHAEPGQNGTRGGNGGGQYGSADIATLDGGSGGAGGSNAGGGGGGGAIQITAAGMFEIGGLISANGGWGGGNPGSNSNLYYGGGGGSGGAVKLVSAIDIMFTGGAISVQGGGAWSGASQANSYARGGFGSPGRVRLEDPDGIVKGIGGSIFPAPSATFVSTPFAGGTGSDGAFNPTADLSLDTSNGPFNYTSVNIPAGVTVTATGTNPLEIFCTGDINIAGTIDISGGNAVNTTSYGVGVAGGGNGGAIGSVGSGPGAGQTSSQTYSSGSGGGYGEVGQKGGYYGRAPGGIQYGNDTINPLLGGSGGGGGVHAAGAAGGGAVRIQAAGEVKITGEVLANGGNAYVGSFGCAGPGGGGSGGAILIQANELNITGSLSARGGRGGATTGCGSGGFMYYKGEAVFMQGAWGAFGRIRLEAVRGNAGGIVMSTKSKYPLGGTTNMMTGTCSLGKLSVNAGLLAQSKFFNSTLVTPTWQAAIVNGNDLGQVKIQYQGADDDGNGNPDLATITAWIDDLSTMPAKQYVRFRVIFMPGSGNPSIEDIELPFN